MLEEFVKEKPRESRLINILEFQTNMGEHAEDDPMKEILGVWYVCRIDNDKERRSTRDIFTEMEIFRMTLTD